MASKVPPTLKGVGSYVKIANEYANRDPVVYYWCLFYAVQHAMQLDKSSPEALKFITGLLGTLEAVKKQLAGNDAITSEVVAQAHIESIAWKLFSYADQREKVGDVDKAVIHAFFTAGHIFDVLTLFGEIDDGVAETKKYAKWICMQINQSIKDGTPYVPHGSKNQQQDDDDALMRELSSFGAPTQPEQPASSRPHDPNPFEQNYGFSQPPANPPVPHHSTVPGGQQNYGFGAPAPPPVPQPPVSSYASHVPAPVSSHANTPPPAYTQPAGSGGMKQPTVQEFTEAKKYIKYAVSACDFEDTKAVIDNLRKAMRLMGEA